MARQELLKERGGAQAGTDAPSIYCKLFGDMVTQHLCVIRRQELDSRGGFSCEGCAMERRPDGTCRKPQCRLPA